MVIGRDALRPPHIQVSRGGWFVREGGRTCVFGQERATGPASSLRLLYLRLALMVLAESPDPTEGAEELLGQAWLLNQYRHSRIKGWKSAFAHNSRSFVFAGDRTAKDHGPGAKREDGGLAGGFAQALDVRGCGRRGWRVRLLSSRTLRRRCDRWLRHASPVATIAISQSRGWSQKIAKTRNDAGGLRLAELGVSDSGNGQAGPRSCYRLRYIIGNNCLHARAKA